MLHVFHYEPQGQRQQFEPREAQENLKQSQMHLHFSLDLLYWLLETSVQKIAIVRTIEHSIACRCR
jgi:hypothetical protein